MHEPTDYYELLHIHPDAPDAVIKASYRAMMQKLKMHPDLGGDVETAAKINEAYAALSNPQSRQVYDASRKIDSAGQTSESEPQAFRQDNGKDKGKDNTSGGKSAPQEPQLDDRVMWIEGSGDASKQCLFCKTPHPFLQNPPADALCVTCDCPLAPATRGDLLAGERRSLDRLKLERQVYFRINSTAEMQTATTADLSLSGLLIESRIDLIANQLVQISSPFCQSLARVAHIRLSDSGVSQCGIEFRTLFFPNVAGSLISEKA